MWKRIAFVFTLGAALAGAPKRPFSHKYHLTQVPACENCHTQAATSTKAEDDLIPDTSACANCHEEMEIPPARPTRVQKFNHARHITAGNAAPAILAAVRNKTYLGATPPPEAELAATKEVCVGCHHGIPASEAIAHDKITKANFPSMADCLVCHSKINPPESCKQCHSEPAVKFRPDSHVAGFLEKHSQPGVERKACATCHGRVFTCRDCHHGG